MKRRFVIALFFMTLVCASSMSQTLADYQYSTGNDASRWYTVTDSTNLLILGSTRYYVRSALENIGFSFPFADTSYTQFSVTHDGNLRLGSELAISASGYQGSPFHPTRAGQNNPKINFMGCAGYTSDSVYVRKQLFGVAPQRVLVVEFATSTYATSSRHSLLRWQVQLSENGDIQIVYPSHNPPILPACTHQQGLCVDASDVWMVDQYHVATHYTDGCSTSIPLGHWPDTNRYYRFEYPDNVCLSPSGFVAPALMSNGVTVAWRNDGGVSSWVVEYATSPIMPGTGAGIQMVVNDTFAVVNSLLPNTQYHLYVRAICDAGDTSNAAHLVVRTPQHNPVNDYPYLCDFEDTDENAEWMPVTGNMSDRWWIGTATNNTPQGQYALYISQDSGATNTSSDTWYGAYVYRDFNLAAGDYSFSFDWRAMGDWHTSGNGTVTYYHFLRAFLVPSDVTLVSQTPPNFPHSDAHGNATPTNWIDLNPATHALVGQSTWTSFNNVVSVANPGCYHLVFYWETDGYSVTTNLPAAIDNISVEYLQCPQPTQITAVPEEHQIALSWHRGGSETLWRVCYDNVEDYTTDTFYLASNLAFNTLYTFAVSSVCGAEDTSLATIASFRTVAGLPVSDFPYVCDFEDSSSRRSWVLLGENQVNQWALGNAVNNSAGGNYALYVSQDGGLTNTYSGTTSALSYAYRLFSFASDTYLCSFDWRCLGDEGYHYMRAFFVPENDIPSAGTFPVTNNIHTAVPNGWIDLNPELHYLSGSSDWITVNQTFSITDSGIYALLLMWQNDVYTPNNPPAAVDNIYIGTVSCLAPEQLTATDITTTSITISWVDPGNEQEWWIRYGDSSRVVYNSSYTAIGLQPNTEYTFLVSTLCDNGDTSLATALSVRTECLPIATLPFTCDFETYTVGLGNSEQFIPCWYRIRNYSTYSPYISESSGNKYLYWSLTAGMLDQVFVVLPEMADNIELMYTELHFKARKYDPLGFANDPVLVVGTMSDPQVASTFYAIDTIVVTEGTNFVQYNIPLLSIGGDDRFVAIQAFVMGSNYISAYCQMDDIELVEIENFCRKPVAIAMEAGIDTIAVSWSPAGSETSWLLRYGDTEVVTSQPSYVVRGLEPNTEYFFAVAAICGEGDTSHFTYGRCRTMMDGVDCPPVSDVAVTVDDDINLSDRTYSAAVSWNGTAPGYEIYYRHLGDGEPVSQIIGEATTYVINGLYPGSTYEVALRSICGGGVYSDWSDTLQFYTPIWESVDGVAEIAKIVLSPNPSSGNVWVSLSGVSGRVDVKVVDVTGHTIMTRHVACNGTSESVLALTGFETGVYFIQVVGNGMNEIRKLIVSR